MRCPNGPDPNFPMARSFAKLHVATLGYGHVHSKQFEGSVLPSRLPLFVQAERITMNVRGNLGCTKARALSRLP